MSKHEFPPEGHPLQKLGACLADWLQDDNFNNVEVYMLEIWSKLTELEQQLAEALLQSEYARDFDPSIMMNKVKVAEEKAAEQGRYAVDMFDESKRAQKSEREAIIRADRAEAKLTEQDKLLDECEIALKHSIGPHKALLTKLRDRKNGN